MTTTTGTGDAGARRARPRPAARVARLLGDIATRWVLIVAGLVVWEVAARRAGSVFFPPPTEIVGAFGRLWLSGDPPNVFTPNVAEDIVPSLSRMLLGWLLAAVAGVGLGVAIGRSRPLSELVMPVVHLLRSTPGPALLPVFLVLLGASDTMRVVLIAFGCVWPILLNTIEGVRGVDPLKLETARVFGMPRTAVLRWVILPAAAPSILAGLRVATAVALVLMVISELVAATQGLGHHLQESQRMFQLTDMWAGIILLSLLGYVFNALYLRWERRMLRWHAGERRR